MAEIAGETSALRVRARRRGLLQEILKHPVHSGASVVNFRDKFGHMFGESGRRGKK